MQHSFLLFLQFFVGRRRRVLYTNIFFFFKFQYFYLDKTSSILLYRPDINPLIYLHKSGATSIL
jgi:hypothetical protein